MSEESEKSEEPSALTDLDYIKITAEELGLSESVRSYSGRYMFGRTCIGIDVDDLRDMGRIMFHLGAINQADDVNITEEVFNFRYDHMGRGYIIYWPEIEYVEDEGSPPPCPNCKSEDTDFYGESFAVTVVQCHSCGHRWNAK